MWKRLKSFFSGEARKRLIRERDFMRLAHILCDTRGMINVDKSDLEILRCGEEAFLWESPLADSAEEAVDLARQAAAEMAPKPGRVILAMMLYIIMEDCEPEFDTALDAVDAISNVVQSILPQDGEMIFGIRFHSKKGIRFLLAGSEGKEDFV